MKADTALKALAQIEPGWAANGSEALDNFLMVLQKRLGWQALEIETATDAIFMKVEMSGIRLRRMGIVPVAMFGGSGKHTCDKLRDFKRSNWGRAELPFVLYTSTPSSKAASKVDLAGDHFVTLSPKDLRELLGSEAPTDTLCGIMRAHVPRAALNPYSFTLPATGPNYFGRTDELRLLKDSAGVDFAIWGPGGAGKTSLLQQLQWELLRERSKRLMRIVFVDLYTTEPDSENVAQAIARAVSPTRFAHVLGVSELEPFLSRTVSQDPRFNGEPIELQIDECDAALAEDRRAKYPLLKALRRSRILGHVRITLCGRTMPKEIFADEECPLYGSMKHIALGSLDKKDASKLLVTPQKQLGVPIDPKSINAVLDETKCWARRIQRWGFEIAAWGEKNDGETFGPKQFEDLAKGMSDT